MKQYAACSSSAKKCGRSRLAAVPWIFAGISASSSFDPSPGAEEHQVRTKMIPDWSTPPACKTMNHCVRNLQTYIILWPSQLATNWFIPQLRLVAWCHPSLVPACSFVNPHTFQDSFAVMSFLSLIMVWSESSDPTSPSPRLRLCQC